MRATGPKSRVSLALAFLLAFGCQARQCGAPVRQHPGDNVILIVVDTLRADHLGLYGYNRPTSPRLDALGARSLVVDHMIAQAPWTKPSVASILTSLPPADHRVTLETTDNILADEILTLAELFRDAGFSTAGFSENPHIHPSLGFDQGFDHFDAETKWKGDPQAMAEKISSWIDGHAAERFFLYAQFLDPHAPYTPRDPYRTQFLEGRTTGDPIIEKAKVNELQTASGELKAELSRDDLDYLVALYDAEIRAVDEALGGIFERLEDLGLAEHTIVLITSDHGEEFLDHGRLEHGKTLFEESIHVPFILYTPGFEARRDPETVVQHTDIAPTLLELANVQVPPEFHGRSLVPLLSGDAIEPRPALSQTNWRNHRGDALRSAEWKLVAEHAAPKPELFHLPSDPREQHDVREANEATAETLARDLNLRLEPTLTTEVNPVGKRNEHLERALESLGYLSRDEN